MANLSLQHIYKVYPAREKKKFNPFKKEKELNSKAYQDFLAVDDFNMEIEDGEFIVFVGPSGCGKSTTLRMIAGLEDISGGEFYIDGVLMNNLEPKDRDIAMVFQSYALYPHMTAFDNIAFGLKMRRVKEEVTDVNGATRIRKRKYTKEEIKEKVEAAAKMLGIEDLLYSKPAEMSGGQRQRIALGRALVRKPKVFLLDEPLSNLDAKLRTQMRSEIVKLHQKIGTTFIYVTHDQVEAMTMGTRIVVMKSGVIQQIDNPTNLFDFPANKFVAGFIGTPQMNFFDVTIQKEQTKLKVIFSNQEEMLLTLSKLRPIHKEFLDGAPHQVTLGVRGEHFIMKETGLNMTLSILEVLGSETHLFAKLTEDGPDYIICVPDRVKLTTGDQFKVSFDEKKIHLFDSQTEQSIMDRWDA